MSVRCDGTGKDGSGYPSRPSVILQRLLRKTVIGSHRIRPHSLEDRPGADHPRGSMIQTDPEDIEQIRARIRKMSDLELRQYGRAARDLANPKKNFGPPNPSFQIQLGRHPKSST
jgi:hypothetical protein